MSVVPRAGVDSITSERDALGILLLARHEPTRHEHLVMVTDTKRRGRTIIDVVGTEDVSLVEVLDGLVPAVRSAARSWSGDRPAYADRSVAGLIIAAVSPGRVAADVDLDQWCEATERCRSVDITLIEWFILGGHDGRMLWCPRDYLGEPPRWKPERSSPDAVQA